MNGYVMTTHIVELLNYVTDNDLVFVLCSGRHPKANIWLEELGNACEKQHISMSFAVLIDDRSSHLNDERPDVSPPVTHYDGYWWCDELVSGYQSIQALVDLIMSETFIPMDFNDVRAVLNKSGRLYIAQGLASGEQRAPHAMDAALKQLPLGLTFHRIVVVVVSGDLSWSYEEWPADML